MITTSDNNTVERFGVSSEQSFKIKANAKAFKILSSNLYTDKVAAIIRELSCNAYDAHVLAGNKTPFLIHLPNNFEPWFSIRDYGVGLSDEDIKNVFTTYFESTKTGSNDYIGCLGLGNKSPFSYVDNFTIISYFAGVKTTYSAFINEEGMPRVATLSEEASNDPNGLEINFAVQSADFYTFWDRSAKVFKHFKLLPTIVGHSVTIETQQYSLKRDTWGIRQNSYNGVKIIMGNVYYSLENYSDETLNEKERVLLGLPLDIYMEIGEADVAASRETLSLDKTTKENIRKRIVKICDEIRIEVEKVFSSCKNLYEVKCLYNTMKTGELACIKKIITDTKLTWNNILIDSGIVSFDKLVDPVTKVLKPKTFEVVYFKKPNYRKKRFTTGNLSYIPATNDNEYYLLDLQNTVLSRAEKWAENNPTKDMGLFVGVKLLAATGLTDFIDALGADASSIKITKISTLPYDKRTNISSGYSNPRAKVSALVYNGTTVQRRRNKQVSTSESWDIAQIDMEEDHIYVPIERYRIHGDYPEDYFSPYFNVLTTFNIPRPVIIGVKDKLIEDVSVKPNWVPFSKWFDTVVVNHFKTNNLIEEYQFHIAIGDLKEKIRQKSHIGGSSFYSVGHYTNTLLARTDLINLVHLEKKDKNNLLQINSLYLNDNKYKNNLVIELVKKNFTLAPVEDRVAELFKSVVKFIKRYPLLPMLVNNHEAKNLFDHYVETINKAYPIVEKEEIAEPQEIVVAKELTV